MSNLNNSGPYVSKDPAKRAKQLANLRPFKPGESARQKLPRQGRTTKLPFSTAQLDAELKRVGKNGKTRAEVILNRLVTSAVNGNQFAIKMILNRYIPEVKASLNINAEAQDLKSAILSSFGRGETSPMPGCLTQSDTQNNTGTGVKEPLNEPETPEP